MKKIILVIADSESVLFLLLNILGIDYEVITYNDDEFEILDYDIKDINLILLSIGDKPMPWSYLEQLRLRFQNIPIILLPGTHLKEEDIAKIFEIGINDMIPKPFFSSELTARVRNLINIYNDKIENDEKLIIHTLEFPPEYLQAGIYILNHFSDILMNKYPDTKAKIKGSKYVSWSKRS